MAENGFFGFSTEIPPDEKNQAKNHDTYDRFNDDTFGSGAVEDDWEAQQAPVQFVDPAILQVNDEHKKVKKEKKKKKEKRVKKSREANTTEMDPRHLMILEEQERKRKEELSQIKSKVQSLWDEEETNPPKNEPVEFVDPSIVMATPRSEEPKKSFGLPPGLAGPPCSSPTPHPTVKPPKNFPDISPEQLALLALNHQLIHNMHNQKPTGASREVERSKEHRDRYANLMSHREKRWVVEIQMKQLRVGNPMVDDYYYQMYEKMDD